MTAASSAAAQQVSARLDTGDLLVALCLRLGDLSRVRGAILDLAVRGKLVPQQREDEAASHLLSRIRDRLGRKARNQRSQEQGGSQNFPLPASWTWSTLGEICEYIQRGKSPTYVEESDIPVVSQKCVQWEVFLLERARFVDPKTRKGYGPERFLRKGDLLWNSTGHGTVGRIALFKPSATFHDVVADSHVTVLRPVEADSRWIWCWIASPTVQRTIDDLVSGTTKQTELATSTVAQHAIPIPPLADQKRIVEKVYQLMALCDELEVKRTKKREIGDRLTKAALGALSIAESPEEFEVAWKRVSENFDTLVLNVETVDALRATIIELGFHGRLTHQLPISEDVAELLSSIRSRKGATRCNTKTTQVVESPPFAVPAGWRWVLWSDLALQTSSGWSPQCLARPRDGSEWGVLKVSAVSWLTFAPEENKALPHGVAPRPEFAVRDQDFLMSRANTAELVGRSVVVESAPKNLLLSDKIVRCEFAAGVNPKFVNLFNRTAAARAHYTANASGTSNSMKNISREVILSMPVPIAPSAVQNRVVAEIERLLSLCDHLEAKLREGDEKAAKLTKALVAQALIE